MVLFHGIRPIRFYFLFFRFHFAFTRLVVDVVFQYPFLATSMSFVPSVYIHPFL